MSSVLGGSPHRRSRSPSLRSRSTSPLNDCHRKKSRIDDGALFESNGEFRRDDNQTGLQRIISS